MAEITTHALLMVTESVLLTPKLGSTARRTSLEIVASDPRVDTNPALYSVNESVLLALSRGKVSRSSLEIVAESDFVPATNVQQTVWFATA